MSRAHHLPSADKCTAPTSGSRALPKAPRRGRLSPTQRMWKSASNSPSQVDKTSEPLGAAESEQHE
ncbi:MAG: hypothetical protein ABSA51_09085 [Anaerolineaceae bacterium]